VIARRRIAAAGHRQVLQPECRSVDADFRGARAVPAAIAARAAEMARATTRTAGCRRFSPDEAATARHSCARRSQSCRRVSCTGRVDG
jgi:hypothetical protein